MGGPGSDGGGGAGLGVDGAGIFVERVSGVGTLLAPHRDSAGGLARFSGMSAAVRRFGGGFGGDGGDGAGMFATVELGAGTLLAPHRGSLGRFTLFALMSPASSPMRGFIPLRRAAGLLGFCAWRALQGATAGFTDPAAESGSVRNEDHGTDPGAEDDMVVLVLIFGSATLLAGAEFPGLAPGSGTFRVLDGVSDGIAAGEDGGTGGPGGGGHTLLFSGGLDVGV